MIRRVRAFAAFWADFLVGDDWRIAAGVAAALAVTYAARRFTAHTWWILPVAVGVLLPVSLWRAVRASRR